MPNGPAFEDAVRIASETPGLGVGIHLSLVQERCVAPPDRVRRLAGDDGSLPVSHTAFIKGYALKRFGPTEIRAEVDAQIRRFLDAGLKPTHLDSHQHLHVLPGVFDIVLDAAEAAGIQVIRIPLERGGPTAHRTVSRTVQTWLLSRFCRKCAQKARKAGMRSADRFWGLGVSGNMNEENLARTIDRLAPGVNEIMCHPGFSDPATSERYPWSYNWDDECAALQSESIRTTIQQRGIRLANFADAWDAA